MKDPQVKLQVQVKQRMITRMQIFHFLLLNLCLDVLITQIVCNSLYHFIIGSHKLGKSHDGVYSMH